MTRKVMYLLILLVMLALPACGKVESRPVRVESAPLWVLFAVDWSSADKEGETMLFVNVTTGGTHPYTKAEWDFNGDGVFDLTVTGSEADVMKTVNYTYNKDGIYNVRLGMTDSTGDTSYMEMKNVVDKAEHPPILRWKSPKIILDE